MALINVPASLPSPMWAVARFLAAEKKPVSIDALQSMLSPPALRDKDGQTFFDAVRTLTEYGAIVETSEKIALSQNWAHLTHSDSAEFVELMRREIFAPERNTGLHETDSQDGPRDLTRALCWFLTLDPLEVSLSLTDVEQRQNGALPDRVGVPIRNDVRFNRFTYWGRALGLITNSLMVSDTRSRLAADCTPAVRATVSRLWAPGQLVDAVEAVAAIRAALPVLPGGVYSVLLGMPSQPDRVDAALSFALLCGHDQGWIELARKADAPRALQIVDPALSAGTRRVTHIAILGGSHD